MRNAILLSFLFVFSAFGADRPKLQVGDPAPPLVVAEWLKGEPIASYQKGRIYVLALWATWCGPCIQSLPELDRLREKYSTKGVDFIAPTSADEKNTRAAVGEFMTTEAARFNVRFAFCTDRALDQAYRVAAGRPGIPCSFVVDRDGKIAFIGSPRDLHLVLPLIIDGAWKGKASMDEWEAGAVELKSIYGRSAEDPAEAARKLPEFERKHAVYCRSDDSATCSLLILLAAGRREQAAQRAERMLKDAEERRIAPMAAAVGAILSEPSLSPKGVNHALAAKCFDVALRIETYDAIQIRLDAIGVYAAAGMMDKAEAAARSAVEYAAKKGAERKKIVAAAVEQRLASAREKTPR